MPRKTNAEIHAELTSPAVESISAAKLLEMMEEVGTTNVPAHQAAIGYQEGDLVWHTNKMYRCKADIVAKPFSAADWTEAAETPWKSITLRGVRGTVTKACEYMVHPTGAVELRGAASFSGDYFGDLSDTADAPSYKMTVFALYDTTNKPVTVDLGTDGSLKIPKETVQIYSDPRDPTGWHTGTTGLANFKAGVLAGGGDFVLDGIVFGVI